MLVIAFAGLNIEQAVIYKTCGNVKSGYKRENWEMFYGAGILKSELHHYACYTCFLEIQKKVTTQSNKIF